MSKFLPAEHYQARGDELELLPLRFERTSDDAYLVANAVGDFSRLSGRELNDLIDLRIKPGDGLYEKAYSALLISKRGQQASKQILAARLRTRMAFLRELTPLHIFVVTLRCEHSCPYCQVSRRSLDHDRYDMSEETAMSALRIALQTPSRHIKIEFQGGEPLLNFPLIQHITRSAREAAVHAGKSIDFVIATNLALLDDDVLQFCKDNAVFLSTSLDGPEALHNRNRPRPGGNSYALAVAGISRARAFLGPDSVSALMTTTEASLEQAEAIIDEYVRLGFDGIFLRSLSPYGFAVKTKVFRKYDSQKWLGFYERGLNHILELNRQGLRFQEYFATLILKRMFSDKSTGYVDLRSPAGIGLGALVYNYDGRVFASDEGRMLAEMQDDTFQLGHVAEASYRDLILSDKMIDFVGSSLTQCAPECSECVFEAHCGADPVYHHATQSDVVGIKPLSDFCARQKGIMRLLLAKLEASPDDANILRRWAQS